MSINDKYQKITAAYEEDTAKAVKFLKNRIDNAILTNNRKLYLGKVITLEIPNYKNDIQFLDEELNMSYTINLTNLGDSHILWVVEDYKEQLFEIRSWFGVRDVFIVRIARMG